MSKQDKLALAHYVISKLGGFSKVAKLCGRSRQSVYHWYKVSGIPDSWEKYLREIRPLIFLELEGNVQGIHFNQPNNAKSVTYYFKVGNELTPAIACDYYRRKAAE